MRRLKIVLLLISLILIRFVWFYSQPVKEPTSEGVVTSEPRVVGNRQQFNLEGSQVVSFGPPLVHLGDRVRLTKGKVKIINNSPVGFYFKTASFIRSKVNNAYQSVLPKAEADLLSGIVLGSIGLDKTFKSKLANVGLTHVVAASGMNVTFVFAMATWFLNRFSLGKNVKTLIALGLIAFYSTLTGFEPPIVRASIMAAFVCISTLIGRQTRGWVGLSVSAYIMLWASPDLISNPSFLLSFTSMTGQIFLSTIKIGLPIIVGSVIEIFLQSLFAILFTFPIVMVFFASFSPISLFTNVLTLWTVEPLMVLGGLIASFGIFFTPFARACALPAQGLLEFFLWVVDFFGKAEFLRFSYKFSDTTAAILFVVGYYLLLAGVIVKRSKRF